MARVLRVLVLPGAVSPERRSQAALLTDSLGVRYRGLLTAFSLRVMRPAGDHGVAPDAANSPATVDALNAAGNTASSSRLVLYPPSARLPPPPTISGPAAVSKVSAKWPVPIGWPSTYTAA